LLSGECEKSEIANFGQLDLLPTEFAQDPNLVRYSPRPAKLKQTSVIADDQILRV